MTPTGVAIHEEVRPVRGGNDARQLGELPLLVEVRRAPYLVEPRRLIAAKSGVAITAAEADDSRTLMARCTGGEETHPGRVR